MNNIPAYVLQQVGSEIMVVAQNKQTCPAFLKHGIYLPAEGFRTGDVGYLNYHSSLTRGRWVFTTKAQ